MPFAFARLFLMLALVAGASASIKGAQAQNATGGLGLTGDQPVQVDGDRLEVFEDQGRAVFEGNVRIVQGDTVMRTSKLVIHYAQGEEGSITPGGSQIERLEVSGGVNIQTATQVATGDAGSYDMASEVLILRGDRVTLTEGGNVATGCVLTVFLADGRSKLEGCGDGGARPTILLQPGGN